MHHRDISKEQISLASIICLLMDTLLSQIFHYDFLSAQLVAVVSGTVPSASIAVGLDEIITAVHALPIHEVWRHQHLVAELLVNVLEILEEIKYKVIVAGIPEIVLNTVIRPRHLELDDN